MKKIYLLFLTIFLSTLNYAQVTELYFSMYGEGSSSNKFLVIYNGTSATVSLDEYAFPNANGGTGSGGNDGILGEYEYWNLFTEGASIASGDVYVIANPNADATILAEADQMHQYLSNGDDGYALVKGGTWDDINGDELVDAGEMTGFEIIDWLGDWNEDPGSGWDVAGVNNATQNHTLTRKASICGPNNDWDASRGTTAGDSEWIVTDSNTGWGAIGSYTGCVMGSTLTITAPADGETIPATTMAEISFSVENFVIGNPGAEIDGHIHWTTDNWATESMHYTTDPINVPVTAGTSYTVSLKLVDNNHEDIEPAVNDTVSFDVAFPCDFDITGVTETCDANTIEVDTYTTTIDFEMGGTAIYTVSTTAGTIGGDDPSTTATGTIEVTGVEEGTNIVVTIVGDATSSCDFSIEVDSPTCTGPATCAEVGDLIITEIFNNATGEDDNKEWFEIFNTTTNDIDLYGWVLKDDGSGSNNHTINTSVVVPAGAFFVLGQNADTELNGGVSIDYAYGLSFILSNGDDEVILSCDANEIDAVRYDGGPEFPDPNGASMELNGNAYDDISNDVGANWTEASEPFGDGVNMGTPGTGFTVSTTDNTIVGFAIYPNPTKGIVNIITTQNLDKNIQIFDQLGKCLFAETINNSSINLSFLQSGIYTIRVEEAGLISHRKIVVK